MLLDDARLECVNFGLTSKEVDDLYVPEFIKVYQSIRRIEARRDLKHLSIIGHAFGANKKENNKFMAHLSTWLPMWEKQGVRTNDDFASVMKGSRK